MAALAKGFQHPGRSRVDCICQVWLGRPQSITKITSTPVSVLAYDTGRAANVQTYDLKLNGWVVPKLWAGYHGIQASKHGLQLKACIQFGTTSGSCIEYVMSLDQAHAMDYLLG